jgi:hypothetical protein
MPVDGACVKELWCRGCVKQVLSAHPREQISMCELFLLYFKGISAALATPLWR